MADIVPADSVPADSVPADGAIADHVPPHDDADLLVDGEAEGGTFDQGTDSLVAIDASSDLSADLSDTDVGSSVDTDPPVLINASVTPAQVDATSAEATITVALQATDATGIRLLTATFALETNRNKTFTTSFLPSHLNSATGAYERRITIPTGQEPGRYVLVHAYLADTLGNWITPTTTTPTAAGFDISTVSFDVVNTGPVDTAAPVLLDVTVTPQQVDVTTAEADITVSLEASDHTGIQLMTVTFALETNRNKTFSASFYPSHYNSATGAYERQITIPRGQEPGRYVLVHAYLADTLGNRVTPTSNDPTAAGFDIRTVSFDVVNTAPVDTAAPVLVDVSLTPQQVDVTSAEAQIAISFKATDESGIALMTATFALVTNRNKTFSTSFYPSHYNSASGAYERPITIPEGQEPGRYALVHAYLADTLGNRVIASSSDPTAAGFDISTVSFEVVNTP